MINYQVLENYYFKRPTSEQAANLVACPDFFKLPHQLSNLGHSKILDSIIGYRIARIEQKLLKNFRPFYQPTDEKNRKAHFQGTQTWIGLHPQILQTPYSELLEICQHLKRLNIRSVVDLGAAYGRVAIVLKCVIPEASFRGYEILDMRANEANRIYEMLQYNHCQVDIHNLLTTDFCPDVADAYFIYDFSERDDIRDLVLKIERQRSSPFYIVAKGTRVNFVLRNRNYATIAASDDWSIYSKNSLS